MIAPWPAADAWSLFSPEGLPRADIAGWARAAQTFFSSDLSLVQTVTHAEGLLPDKASLEIALTARGRAGPSFVRVQTLALDEAPALRAAAEDGVRAIGGAGFDALLARAKRLWQVRSTPIEGDEPLAPALVAAVLSHTFSAPVVPPGGGTIHGVRGVRVWLTSRGWRG